MEISTQSVLNGGTYTEQRITQFVNTISKKWPSRQYPVTWNHQILLVPGVHIFIAYLLQSYGSFTTYFKVLSQFSDLAIEKDL